MTSPRTGAQRSRPVTATSQIDARTRIGEIYVTSLLRAQLRLALGVLGVAVGSVAGLPLLFAAFPGLADRPVLGMPLAWVLLAFAVYPFLFLCGWVYVRRAERHEQAFTAVVGSGEDDR